MVGVIFDLSLVIDGDNPFISMVGETDIIRRLPILFNAYRNEHPREFTFIKNIYSETSIPLSSNVMNVIGGFFHENPNIITQSEGMKNWLMTIQPAQPTIPAIPPASLAAGPASQPQPGQPVGLATPSTPTVIEPAESFAIERSVEGDEDLDMRSMYDAISNRTLSYEEVIDLCFNIAKSKHVSSNVKNINLRRVEEERRRHLIESISKYLCIQGIGIVRPDDLSKMDGTALEELLTRCESRFETLKAMDVMKSGLNVGSTLVSSIFPEGIPLGRKYRLKFKNIKDTVTSTLFSPNTPTGAAFSMYLDKHHFRINNGTLIATKIVEIALNNLEVVKVDGPRVEEPEEPSPEDEFRDMPLQEMSD